MKLQRLTLWSGLLLLLGAVTPLHAEGWGTIKGQVIWAGPGEPERPEIKVTADPTHCLSKGPLHEQTYIVDKNTRGVRYVMVWLVSAKEPKKYDAPLPIHPSLKEVKEKKVYLDQPTCLFEPPVLAMREGQVLESKNTAPVPHNVKIDGAPKNPSLNQIVPPGKSLEVEGWKATGLGAVPVGCTIHGWMKGYIRVFNHPYYAVTDEKGQFEIKDAPAGDFRLVIWHPTALFVQGDRTGVPITIKAGGTTDLGKIDLKPPKD